MEQKEANKASEVHGNRRESANSADKTHCDITSGDDDKAASNKTQSNKAQGSSEKNSKQRVQGPHRVKRHSKQLKVQFSAKFGNSRTSKDVQECSENATTPAKAQEPG